MKNLRHVLLGLVGLCTLASFLLLWLVWQESRHLQEREQTSALALNFSNELRNDSRQLTSLARNAVIMGDQEAEMAYYRILDIRHGKTERGQSLFVAPGARVAFEVLLRQLDISNGEEQALMGAYLGSERLVLREIQAMNMARGVYAAADGQYSERGPANRDKALDLLFDQFYRKSAVDILEQVNIFFESVSRRFNDEYKASQQRINALIIGVCLAVFVGLASFMVLMLRASAARTEQRRLMLAYALTMIVILVSTAGPAWIVYSDARQVLLGTVEKRLSLLAREVERELVLRVRHTVELARIAAQRPPVLDAFNAHPDTPQGRAALHLAEEVLQRFTTGYADVARTVLLSRGNRILASGAVSEAGADFKGLAPDDLQKVLLGQSLVMALENSGHGELLVAVPVVRGEHTEGVLVMVLDKRYALMFWEGRLIVDENIGIFILDSQNRIIVTSLGEEYEGRPVFSTILRTFLSEGREGLVRFTGPRGDERMGYLLRMRELPWVVGVSSSYTSMLDQAGQVLVRASFFGVGGVLLSIILVSLLLRYFINTLRRAHERVESIIESAGMYTWDYDVRNAVFHHNAQWCRVTGMADVADGTLPVSWLLERLYPDDVHLVTDLAGKLGLDAQVNFEFRLRMPTGEYRWLSSMGRVEDADAAGYTVRVAGVGYDSHDRKMAELSEVQQKQRLEELVESRTQELVESRNQAEAASQAKSTFLSTVSHEIRTPMNAIVGFTHLFKRANLEPEQKSFLDKIKLSADTLLNVINDVLDISKIEAGKLELERVPFRLEHVLRTVQSVAEYGALEKHLQLSVAVGDTVPPCFYGDPKRITQILLNLINNAIKFTSKGRVKMAVRLAESDELDPSAVLLAVSVTDTGIGLSDMQRARLFKPFSQADSSVTRKYGGTGLGLAICKELVELMGGHIGVESTLGKGSTFFFTLRLTVAEALPDEEHVDFSGGGQAAVATEKAADRALVAYAGAAVLVAEDNAVNQEIARMILESCGMQVTLAENGRQALDLVQLQRFSLIFMDMQMPIMGGEEATRHLRDMGKIPEFEWLSRVPIIAMTANVMAEDRRRCLEAGMNDHLPKPFDPATLKTLLLRWLE